MQRQGKLLLPLEKTGKAAPRQNCWIRRKRRILVRSGCSSPGRCNAALEWRCRGGRELGVPLEKTRSDLIKANFDEGTGKVHIAGEITLDYVPVRVVADIDRASLGGEGHPEILNEKDKSAAQGSAA